MTQIKRLENIRREFVANVSHELKTPITSVKGFIETLREDKAISPEDSGRFLGIISKQTDRFNTLVDDLLMLSRIENEAEGGEFDLQRGRLLPVIKSAISACEVQAQKSGIKIIPNEEVTLEAAINFHNLEQALINLIDNAVKFSDPGCGIDKAHWPRLFERFYRVDKARSKELGGTGLGLAIVKHIALAHGGRVSVESTPGKGSVFTIFLPAIS